MKNLLLEYANYNYWANKKLIGLLKGTEDVWEKELISSFPTIRATIFHIWDAEILWLRRLQGSSPNDWPSKAYDKAGMEALDKWQEASQELIDHIRKYNEEELQAVLEYKTTSGTPMQQRVYQIIQHLMNHGTFHRGQLVTMLRNAGVTENIPTTDLIAYYREMN